MDTNIKTTVINLNNCKMYDVFCGRPTKNMKEYKEKFGKFGEWGNPFFVSEDGDRLTVIYKYTYMILNDKEKLIKIPSLRGKVLACYCIPEPCHVQVLAYLANNAKTMVDAYANRRSVDEIIKEIFNYYGWEIPKGYIE